MSLLRLVRGVKEVSSSTELRQDQHPQAVPGVRAGVISFPSLMYPRVKALDDKADTRAVRFKAAKRE